MELRNTVSKRDGENESTEYILLYSEAQSKSNEIVIVGTKLNLVKIQPADGFSVLLLASRGAKHG